MGFTKLSFRQSAMYLSAVRSSGQRTYTPYYRRLQLVCSALLACLFVGVAAESIYAQSCPLYPSPHLRVGYNVTRDGGVDITDYAATQLGGGWYHDYNMRMNPPEPGGIIHHQMVRANGRTTPEKIQELLPQVGRIVDANPGDLLILGNEVDRHGQDGLTPNQYARFYHDLYYFIKQRDPSSRIAIAGIVQPTQLRLRYLDMVLNAYQQQYGETMPVEIWDIHNFILPENCGWGAGIPPGLDAYASEGTPCPASLAEHGNIETFKQQLRNFRQWMKSRGYQDRPLIISEYGILLSQYHGFPYSTVRNYMLASFDFMLNTKDSATGYPADENRLVQEFAWFSLNFYEFDLATYSGLNGNLFDHNSRQIKPLGTDFANYTSRITIRTVDLGMKALQATPNVVNGGAPVTLQASFVNSGGVAAEGVNVRFYAGDPRAQGQLLGTSPTFTQVLPGCQQTENASFIWTPTQAGAYTIFAELVATNQGLESNGGNNYASQVVNVQSSVAGTPTATATQVPPTATATATFIPGASTPTATATFVPGAPTPTATPTATLAPGEPTHTPTATLAPGEPTYTPTATLAPGEPTHTPTATLAPGEPTHTPTATLAPGEPTHTPTATLIPGVPTLIATVTATPVAQGNSDQNKLYLPLITH